MTWQRLTITVDGNDGRLPARALIKVLRAAMNLVESIHDESESDESEGRIQWTIEKMTKINPGVVTVAADLDDEIDLAVRGLRRINEVAEMPRRFTMRSLRYAKDLVSVLDHGVQEVVIQNGHEAVVPTQHVSANADELIGAKFYYATASLVGRLSVINVRRELRISIEDEAYTRSVECECAPEFFERAKMYLNSRVIVTGEVRYRRLDDTPVSIVAQDIEPLSEDHRGFDELKPIDITGGLSSEEYVRRMRDGA